MSDRTDEDSGPLGTEERQLGHGLFEEEMPPGSAMAHLYRGEIHRMQYWRDRLDRTTYWAVTVLAAILTWAFSRGSPHYIVLIAGFALTGFLVIEARRFRGYDIWRSRVRLLQQNVFATALDPSAGVMDPDWRRELSEDYRHPEVKIPFEEALAHRLRRVYLALFSVLFVAWAFRITAFMPPSAWPASAAIGALPGTAVSAIVAVFYGALLVVALRPRTWHVAGELRTTNVGAWDETE